MVAVGAAKAMKTLASNDLFTDFPIIQSYYRPRLRPCWPEPMSDKAPARHGPDASGNHIPLPGYRRVGQNSTPPCDRHHRGSVSPHPTLRQHERSIQEHAIRGIGSQSGPGFAATSRTQDGVRYAARSCRCRTGTCSCLDGNRVFAAIRHFTRTDGNSHVG